MKYYSPALPLVTIALADGGDAFATTFHAPLSPSFHSPRCAGLGSSAFTQNRALLRSSKTMRDHSSRGVMLMYEPSSYPAGSVGNDVWSALASTERWISEKLQNSGPCAEVSATSNPYSRKEVSYVCETADNLAAVVGSTFRRLRDARELGEALCREEELRIAERGPDYVPGNFKQTHIVVVPFCGDLNSSYKTFENIMQAVNRAWRNARDYITNDSPEKLYGIVGDDEMEWKVDVNSAHMHPQYGEKTPEEILAEMEQEESEGEVDLNNEAYNEMRYEAQRSPFPTLVIEVKASWEHVGSSSAEVQKLEVIFRLPAAMDHPIHGKKIVINCSPAAGNTVVLDEFSVDFPINAAYQWVVKNDPLYKELSSTFVLSEARHVDAAFEFAFSKIGIDYSMKVMQQPMQGKRNYVVMPYFLTASATCFDRFGGDVSDIIGSIPGLSNVLEVSTLHPESIYEDRRAPVPILVLNWL